MGSTGAARARVSGNVPEAPARPFDGKVKLEGIRTPQDARASKNLQPGDIIMYNYGYTGVVVRIIPSKSGKTFSLVTRSSSTGKEYTRKTTADRLWAVTDRERKE